MKIIKSGREEQRKFVCPECNCIFSCTKSECVGYNWTLFEPEPRCPQCRHFLDIKFNEGELIKWGNSLFDRVMSKTKLFKLWRNGRDA